ncbi:hypothetical protein N5D48_04000 [Pseudomonas sp. GD03858]|nr:hypothetical protein [Pseudomonas sp. GD03858]MDH0661553.1 hypothetical protein [Pseudomonas sp. GD03858]
MALKFPLFTARARCGLACISLVCSLLPASPASFADEESGGYQPRRDNPLDFGDQIDRVDLRSGNLILRNKDISISGNGGLDLEVWRQYDMRSASSGLVATHNNSWRWAAMGPGWSISVAPRISERIYAHDHDFQNYYDTAQLDVMCNANSPTGRDIQRPLLQLPNGMEEEIFPGPNQTAYTKSNWRITCAGGNLLAQAPNGTTYDFGTYATRKVGVYMRTSMDERYEADPMTYGKELPLEIYFLARSARDTSGNTLTYAYQQFGPAIPPWGYPSGPSRASFVYLDPGPIEATVERSAFVLSSVTASDGRQLTFSYDPNTRKLLSILDGTGRKWSYAYQGADNYNSRSLVSVTLPTGEQWSYAYAPGAWQDETFAVRRGSMVSAQPRKLIKMTLPTGGSVSYTYGSFQYMGQINLQQGERITSRTLSTGQKWTYAFTRGQRTYDTTQVDAPDGKYVYQFMGPAFLDLTERGMPSAYQNNAWQIGQLMSVTDPQGNQESYTYDKRELSPYEVWVVDVGRTFDAKSWAPLTTSRTYTRDGATYKTVYSAFDAYGNPGTRTETGPNGGSRTTTLTWHNDPARWIIGLPKDETSPGLAITRSYDANGKLLNMTRNGVPVSYTYDAQGNLASKTLPGNRVHGYANYKRGIAQHETQPEGVVIARVVDDAGNVTAYTDGEQHTTRYAYDGLNRVTAMTPPLGTAQTTAYTATSKTASRGALVETTQYDPFGRVASTTLGGITTRYEYDAMGRRSFVSAPNAATGTRYQYDPLGRLTRVTHADNSFQAIAYGPGSRSVTDERGQTTTYTYRAYGDPNQPQLMAIAAPEPSASVTLARDGADRLTAVTQGGKTRTYGYNANGYLTSVTQPETGTTTYGRDIAGNLTSRQVGASAVSTFAYDGQNRQVTALYPSDGHSIRNTYDRTGKLLASVSPSGNHSMTYDAAGNLASETVALDSQVFTARYAYNGNDQLSSITYPHSARVVSYSPDVLGRPTTVSGYVNNVSYWPSGMVRQITYANGTQSSYEQNARLWPASFSTAKTGVATYLNSAYGYDGNGNLLSVSDSVDGAFNRTLGYDAINRLTSVAGFWGAGSIAYDGGGNLLRQTLGGATLDYAYDAQNRLAAVSGLRAASLGYDAYGNVASSAGNSYRYNDVPNLVCINCATPASKVEYQYDGLNQRSSVTRAGRKVYEMHDRDGRQLIELDGGTLTEYFYLGDKRIAQRVTP